MVLACLFSFWVPLLKPRSGKKGTLSIQGLLGNLVMGRLVLGLLLVDLLLEPRGDQRLPS